MNKGFESKKALKIKERQNVLKLPFATIGPYNGLYATNIETDDGFALLEGTLVIDNHNNEDDLISTPTYEQVKKWFRGKMFDMFIKRNAYRST